MLPSYLVPSYLCYTVLARIWLLFHESQEKL